MNNNNLESQNYLICKLNGFNNLTLCDNHRYEINSSLIKSIFIDDNLERMTVEFQNNITYAEYTKEIENFLYHICFNLIVKTGLSYHTPTYSIEVIYENNKPLYIKDILKIRDSITLQQSLSSESMYRNIINSATSIEDNIVKYERIFKTLHNPNKVVQFMSLYQFLMELLQNNKPYTSQRSVIDYLQTNIDKYNFLEFKQTRKEGKTFDEDCFTYIRNQIGHSEETNDFNLYKTLGKQVTQQLIKNLIIVINDVIIDPLII